MRYYEIRWDMMRWYLRNSANRNQVESWGLSPDVMYAYFLMLIVYQQPHLYTRKPNCILDCHLFRYVLVVDKCKDADEKRVMERREGKLIGEERKRMIKKRDDVDWEKRRRMERRGDKRILNYMIINWEERKENNENNGNERRDDSRRSWRW